MSGRTSGLFSAIVSFEDARGRLLTGKRWRVVAFDQDPLLDHRLGRAEIDDQGEATLLIAVADIKSLDSPGERTPDLYFVLYDAGMQVFKTRVLPDVDFEELDPVSGEPAHITRRFGPFRVDWDA